MADISNPIVSNPCTRSEHVRINTQTATPAGLLTGTSWEPTTFYNYLQPDRPALPYTPGSPNVGTRAWSNTRKDQSWASSGCPQCGFRQGN